MLAVASSGTNLELASKECRLHFELGCCVLFENRSAFVFELCAWQICIKDSDMSTRIRSNEDIACGTPFTEAAT